MGRNVKSETKWRGVWGKEEKMSTRNIDGDEDEGKYLRGKKEKGVIKRK